LIEDPNSILARHRSFLKELETKKQQEREEAMLYDHMKEQKEQKFREQAAKQRDKIKGLKGADPATLEAMEPTS
jgi:parvulin-like peptidyl-prolyl isomerase